MDDVQFKEFSITKRKLDLEQMSELGKPFPKELKIKVQMPHVNKKPLARNRSLVQTEN